MDESPISTGTLYTTLDPGVPPPGLAPLQTGSNSYRKKVKVFFWNINILILGSEKESYFYK